MLHLFTSTPLAVIGAIAATNGDETGIGVFWVSAAISLSCEVLAYLSGRFMIQHHEIDKQGVRCDTREVKRTGYGPWFEPLTSYVSVDWHEKLHKGRSGAAGGPVKTVSSKSWRVELRHSTDPFRSVKIFGSAFFAANQQQDLAVCRAITGNLGLPMRQLNIDGEEIAAVEFPEATTAVPDAI